jgi:guanylate kinase
MSRGEIFIVSAPSGTGKSTLIREVLTAVEGLEHCVSHTTRRPRPGESDGIAYFFVDRHTFSRMIEQDAFLEWAEYNGNLYGTSVEEADSKLDKGIDLILDIEVVGAAKLLERRPEAHAVFVLPPGYEVLRRRLLDRGSEQARDIAERLTLSLWEIERYNLYHYVIINDDLERASQALAAIILEKRQRLERQGESVQEVLEDFRRHSPADRMRTTPREPSDKD